MPGQLAEDISCLSRFLARRDVESLASATETFDAIILLGSAVLESVWVAGEAYRLGLSDRVLISGGIGHSTQELWEAVRRDANLDSIAVEGRAEADIFRDILTLRERVPGEAVIVENVSTNCGANAWESKRVLAEMGLFPGSLLLIQDPTMQCRTHASFQRAWRSEKPVRFVSFAPFVPYAFSMDEEAWDFAPHAWSRPRFLSLLLGEIPRLLDVPSGYGPNGSDFIEHVDIPPDVLEAHSRLHQAYAQIGNR